MRVSDGFYCVLVYLHSFEQYFPLDAEEWFRLTKPIDVKAKNEKKNKGDKQAQGRSWPVDEFGKPFPRNFVQKSSSVKVHFRDHKYEDGSRDISYNIFFAYNGAKRVLTVHPTGAHESDLEEFHVHFLPSGEVGFYGLSAHGGCHVFNLHPSLRDEKRFQGKWKPSDVLEHTSEGRPIVYAACNSHALYGKPGVHVRLGCFGNDTGEANTPLQLHLSDITKSEIWSWDGFLGSKAGIKDFKRRFDKRTQKPACYKKIEPHPPTVHTKVMWLFVPLWLVIPLILFFALDVKLQAGPALIWAIVGLVIQFHIIKLNLRIIGGPVGCGASEETTDQCVFPCRFY